MGIDFAKVDRRPRHAAHPHQPPLRRARYPLRAEYEDFYQGVGYGWQKMIAGLEQVAAKLT
jgi:hypothetical protein